MHHSGSEKNSHKRETARTVAQATTGPLLLEESGCRFTLRPPFPYCAGRILAFAWIRPRVGG